MFNILYHLIFYLLKILKYKNSTSVWYFSPHTYLIIVPDVSCCMVHFLMVRCNPNNYIVKIHTPTMILSLVSLHLLNQHTCTSDLVFIPPWVVFSCDWSHQDQQFSLRYWVVKTLPIIIYHSTGKWFFKVCWPDDQNVPLDYFNLYKVKDLS